MWDNRNAYRTACLYRLTATGFATRRTTKKCHVLSSISLVFLSPREGNILYLFTERRLEPGPARNSSPGVSPWWEQSGGTDAMERCQCPAFWAWQMRSESGHITASAILWQLLQECSYAANTPAWNGLGTTPWGPVLQDHGLVSGQNYWPDLGGL